MIYEKFARLFCETDWLNLQLDSVDRLVDQVEATEDQQVLLDQEDQLVILVFKEKLDKEAFPDYLVCLVLQDRLDLKEIVDTLETLVHQVLVQWDQRVFEDLPAMWDLPVLVLLELKASGAYLADRDRLVPLATVHSVMALLLKQTDKQTKKD